MIERAQDKTKIEFRNYSLKTKDEVEILKNVSFKLPEGKMTALLGLSGDGKSTIMNRIVGICDPTHKTYGEILIDTENGLQPRTDVATWFCNISYCEQEIISYDRLTASQIIYDAARVNGKTKKEAKAMIEEFKITKSRKTKFKNLSGGEKRRVFVICSLLENKQISIYDEPVSGLDSNLAFNILKKIKNSGSTSLVSVHQISKEIFSLFDHVMFIYNGTIIYSDSIDQIVPFFETHGIDLKKNEMFCVTYLIYLFSNSQISISEVEDKTKLDILANAIIDKCGEIEKNEGGNIYIVRPDVSIRWSEVWYILKNMLGYVKTNFLNHFPAEYIVGCAMAIFIILGLEFLVFHNKITTMVTSGKPRKIDSSNLSLGEQLTRIENETEVITAATLENIKSYLYSMGDLSYRKYYKYFINILLLERYILLLPMVFLSLFLSSVLFGTYTGDSKYYQFIKKQVQKNSLKASSYLYAQIIEAFITKVLFFFILQLSFFIYISYYTSINIVYSQSTASLIPLIFGLFIISVFYGLLYLSLYYVPLNQKLRALFSFLFSTMLLYGYLGIYFIILYAGKRDSCLGIGKNLSTYSSIVADGIMRDNIDIIGIFIGSTGAIIAKSIYSIAYIPRKMCYFLLPYNLYFRYGLKNDEFPETIDSFLSNILLYSKIKLQIGKDQYWTNEKVKLQNRLNIAYQVYIYFNQTLDIQSQEKEIRKVIDSVITSPPSDISKAKETTFTNLRKLITIERASDSKLKSEIDVLVSLVMQNKSYPSAHEPLSLSGSIATPTGWFDLIWSFLLVAVPIGLIFSLFLFYKYKRLQPQLR
ncbi:ATP-binding cassette, subfamily G (WHITE), member 1 [Nematocida sp. LUAm3]|nr:ATP-binding cassette, subfamily G (WHITE), member 1 [Nematocida sp. LUAm3]KAI5174023.1 ATP-binding cassette, subfamily G (WHITE), member 1 [Nematocida sp. LUAm2]KAI5177234.1 ATP-binding cassette, subfamily G (WHITE), member 1 [Nematocida sp. LUAm1]